MARESHHERQGSQAVGFVFGRRVGVDGHHREHQEWHHQDDHQRHDREVRIADLIGWGLDRQKADQRGNGVDLVHSEPRPRADHARGFDPVSGNPAGGWFGILFIY